MIQAHFNTVEISPTNTQIQECKQILINADLTTIHKKLRRCLAGCFLGQEEKSLG